MSKTNGEGYIGFPGGSLLLEDVGEMMLAGKANEQEVASTGVSDDMAQKEKEVGTYYDRNNDIMDARQLGGSEFLNGGEFGNKEETSSVVDAITHQSKTMLEKNFHLTQELALGLFQELQSFLKEATDIEKNMREVKATVHAESERLDNLEPQVESATRSFATVN